MEIKSQFEDGIEKKVKSLQKDFLRVKPKPNDFELQPELVTKRVARFKKYPEEYTHIAMDTRDIHQIDIDCPEYSDEITNILNSHPYTGSSTKALK